MKRNLIAIITLLTLLIFNSSESISISIAAVTKYPGANDYVMNLTLDTANKTLSGNEIVSYINNTNTDLNEIYFHIYSNSSAYKALKGGMDIKSIIIAKKAVTFSFICTDKSMIKIKLNNTIGPNEKIEIVLNYKLRIPHAAGSLGCSFGYGKGTYNLGNFFPIVAVYDENGWDIHPYDRKGDPFYSETSNFDVNITAPKNQVIASTGVINKIMPVGGSNIWQIKAYSVRDFAFVASSKFKVSEGKIDGITVKAYGVENKYCQRALKIGMDAIKIFNNKYGKYPYQTCSIVQSDIVGGMEYPNLVMIDSITYASLQCATATFGKIYDSLIAQAEFEIVHEIAHQWWYGLVGNDEYKESWIDEPLAQCSTLDYFKTKYGMTTYNIVLNDFINRGYKSFLRTKTEKSNLSLNRDLSKFEEQEYAALIYGKGALMFNDLRAKLGDAKFNLFEKTLFNEYKFKIIKGNELIKLASKIAGQDMTMFFHNWLDK